jgi:uncharacterized protein
MIPVSLEEKIICYADKFFSKNGDTHLTAKSIERIKRGLEKYGRDKMLQFQSWAEWFEKA